MSVTGFQQHQGTALPLARSNIDTDAILPKQFLQKVTRVGFGQHLFHDWRYLDEQGSQPNPDFILNYRQYQQASILISKENFGCGSSREHAPWALIDYGFKVIIAQSFADIFYNNALNNQLLAITLAANEIDRLLNTVTEQPQTQLSIDLVQQTVRFAGNHCYSFTLDPFRRYCLLNGLDNIELTLQHQAAITAYEQQQANFCKP